MTTTTVDLYSRLPESAKVYLDTLTAYRLNSGLMMKKPDDDGGDDGGDGGGDDGGAGDGDDDFVDLDPDEKIKVDGKILKVGDLQRIFAREKRQGKKAGQAALIKELGYDSLDELRDALADAADAGDQGGSGDGGSGSGDGGNGGGGASAEDARKARERQQRIDQREREAARKERRLDLRGALRDEGVSRDDLDDAFALLDAQVDREYDEDDLEDEVEKLKKRRPQLFGVDDEGKGHSGGKGKIPAGAGRTPPRRSRSKPGDEGRRRAAARGWGKKDDDAK